MADLAKLVCVGLLPIILGISGCVGTTAPADTQPTPIASGPTASPSPESGRSGAVAYINERQGALSPAFVHSGVTGEREWHFSPSPTEVRIIAVASCFVPREEPVEIVLHQAGRQLASMSIPCTRDPYTGELGPTGYSVDAGDVAVRISDPEIAEVRVFGFTEKEQ